MIPKIEFSRLKNSNKEAKLQTTSGSPFTQASLQYGRYFNDLSNKVENIYKLQMLRNSLFESKCKRQLNGLNTQKSKLSQQLKIVLDDQIKKKQQQPTRRELKTINKTLKIYEKMMKSLEEEVKVSEEELRKQKNKRKQLRKQIKERWKNKIQESQIQKQLLSSIKQTCRINTQCSPSTTPNQSIFVTDKQISSMLGPHSRKSSLSHNKSISESFHKILKQSRSTPKQIKNGEISNEKIELMIKKMENQNQEERYKIMILRMFVVFLRNCQSQKIKEGSSSVKNGKILKTERIRNVVGNKTKISNFISKHIDRHEQKLEYLEGKLKKIREIYSVQQAKQNAGYSNYII